MNYRIYWFFRNLSALILNILIIPIYFALYFLEALYDGFRITFNANGSEILDYPWQNEWPFFREDE